MQARFAELRGEMQAGFRELGEKIDADWRRTRGLYEQLEKLIKTIGEHRNGKPAKGTSATSKRKR